MPQLIDLTLHIINGRLLLGCVPRVLRVFRILQRIAEELHPSVQLRRQHYIELTRTFHLFRLHCLSSLSLGRTWY